MMNDLSLEGAGPLLGPFVSYLKCSLHNGPRVQWRRHARAKSESSKAGQMQRIGKAGEQKTPHVCVLICSDNDQGNFRFHHPR